MVRIVCRKSSLIFIETLNSLHSISLSEVIFLINFGYKEKNYIMKRKQFPLKLGKRHKLLNHAYLILPYLGYAITKHTAQGRYQNITTYGLPKPLEFDYELSKYDRAIQVQRYEQLELAQLSNSEQKEFIDRFKNLFHIVQSNEERAPVFIFLTGSGGTGKSCVAAIKFIF